TGQRLMNGDQNGAQVFVSQHHGVVLDVAALGQNLGVARGIDTAFLHGQLVQWGGDDGTDQTGLGIINSVAQVFVGAASGLSVNFAIGKIVGQGLPAIQDGNEPLGCANRL